MTAMPLMVFEGNCQAQRLAAVFDSSGCVEAVHVGDDYGYIPYFGGRLCRSFPLDALPGLQRSARAAGRRVIRCLQTSPFAKPNPSNFEGTEIVAMFPAVTLLAMNTSEFEKAYKVSRQSVQRIYDLDIRNVEANQKKANFPIDVSRFIADALPNRPLFHSVWHPCGEVEATLCSGLLHTLEGAIDTSSIHRVVDILTRAEGINITTDHPMPDDDMKALGFEWGEPYLLYCEMIRNTRCERFEIILDSMDKYGELFCGDTQYLRAIAGSAFNTGRYNLAELYYNNLVERDPGVFQYWRGYAELIFAGANRHVSNRAMNDLLCKANKVLKGTNLRYIAIASILRQFGRHGYSRKCCTAYSYRTQNRKVIGQEALPIGEEVSIILG